MRKLKQMSTSQNHNKFKQYKTQLIFSHQPLKQKVKKGQRGRAHTDKKAEVNITKSQQSSHYKVENDKNTQMQNTKQINSTEKAV